MQQGRRRVTNDYSPKSKPKFKGISNMAANPSSVCLLSFAQNMYKSEWLELHQ